MTMRTSWLLVVAAFLALIAILGAAGLLLLERSYDVVAELAPHAGQLGEQQLLAFSELADQLRLLIFGVLLAAAIIAGVVAWGITRNVLRPLQRLVASFDAMAYGDLSVPIGRFGNNEIGQLGAAVAALQQRLSRSVAMVRISSDAVHQGAKNIASGNNKFSTRTEQQAARLRKAAASMESLAATVRQNAESARDACALAGDAAQAAGAGDEVVTELIERIHEITQRSQQVSELVAELDAIASQTNMLAVSASVEAVRAGDHGKEFGVVAREVQGLAGRSADAAKGIRALVDPSMTGTDNGTASADRASRHMGKLVTTVHKVNDLMDRIASASERQSQRIAQANKAIAQMGQVTQQDADLVRQEAKAADQLEEAAAQLKKAVAVFKLSPDAESQFSGPEYDEAVSWMESLTPDDLADLLRPQAKRSRRRKRAA